MFDNKLVLISISLLVFFTTILILIKLSSFLAKKLRRYPYHQLDSLFTPTEISFLEVLNLAVSNEAYVFGKVRIADVVLPREKLSKSEWQKYFNKVSSKHFDFVICSKIDLSILCVIELNDKSHEAKDRKERDKFVVGVCKSAALPLVVIKASDDYKIEEIEQAILPLITSEQKIKKIEKIKKSGKKKEPSLLDENQPNEINTSVEKIKISEAPMKTSPVFSEPVKLVKNTKTNKGKSKIKKEKKKNKIKSTQIDTVNSDSELCPSCQSLLTTKTAKKGKHIGKDFIVCTSFPTCKYIEPVVN